VHEHRAPAHVGLVERQTVDRALVPREHSRDHAVEIGERRQGKFGQVLRVGVAMERAVEVRPGVRDHLDRADEELGPRRMGGA
jgi:hypothetical protein